MGKRVVVVFEIKPTCPTPKKVGFESSDLAIRELKKCRRVFASGVNQFRKERAVYMCPCGKWHLTSHPRVEQGKAAREEVK